MIRNFKELLDNAGKQTKARIIVAAAQDADVIKAVSEAKAIGLAEPVLVGDESKIKGIMDSLEIKSVDYEIINEPDMVQAAKESVKLVRNGKGDFLMKGLLQTADIMRAVLDKEEGLRTDNLISHVMVYEVPTYNKLLYLTDGGMNVAPNLEQKVQILENAIKVCKGMKMDRIYVSCLAGAETVNPKIPATVDAEALANMKEKWEVLDAVVEGPVALDLAISSEACAHKGYKGEGGGKADILLVPYYEVGNALGKSLTYFAGAKSAGIIMGARVPIVLVSRADSSESKLLSIALGCVLAGSNNK